VLGRSGMEVMEQERLEPRDIFGTNASNHKWMLKMTILISIVEKEVFCRNRRSADGCHREGGCPGRSLVCVAYRAFLYKAVNRATKQMWYGEGQWQFSVIESTVLPRQGHPLST